LAWQREGGGPRARRGGQSGGALMAGMGLGRRGPQAAAGLVEKKQFLRVAWRVPTVFARG